MPRNPNPPPAKEVRTFINPMAIQYDTPDGHTFRYHREWHDIELRIDTYRVTRSLGSTERDFSVRFQDDDGILQAAYDDWDGMSEEGRARVEDVQRRQIVASQNRDFRRLQGWGEISNDRTLNVFEVGRNGNPQGDYERAFKRVNVNIRAFGDEDRLGSIFLSESDGHRYSDADDGEDYVTADLVVRAEILEALEKAIRETGVAPVLTLHLDALVYQTEVERSLAERWMRQDYFMMKEYFAPLSLTCLTWDAASRQRPMGDETADEVSIDSVPIANPTPAAGTEIARRISKLTIAVWCLVAAVIAAAILR